MSLLLDALKKAAKDKQRADEDSNVDQPPSAQDNQTEANNPVEPPEELDALEFTIDDADDQTQHENITSTDLESKDSELDQKKPEQDDQTLVDAIDDESNERLLELDSAKTATTTVSEEALHMLVFKTNNEHRRAQKILLTSIITLACVTLVLGGFYFYSTMIDDVELLERNHKIAMLAVRSHEVKKPKSQAAVSGIKNATTAIAAQASATVVNARAKNTAGTNRPVANQKNTVINFKKFRKQNPISSLLGKAWSAYQLGDYNTAEAAYTKVLQREANNRDALLGMGAIAIKKGETARARAAYINLLQLDPRDSIANAALVNLEKSQTDTLTESKLKFMLQRQTDAPHLHFALGNIYAQQQLWPEAQKSYFNAWQGNNKNADYAFNLAVSLDQIGEKKQASRFYQASLKLAQGQNISFSIETVETRISQLENKGSL